MISTLALAFLSIAPVAQDLDTDNDGLPDEWEIRGHGPIDVSRHGCSPRRPDVFLVAVIRPSMRRQQVAETMERVKQFFASIPGSNPDGSSGINVIWVWGNSLDAGDEEKSYRDLYDKGMPGEWKSIGHGILLEPGTGGGGQTNRRDWSGVSNNWHTVVHELGHQFGLGHEPPGTSDQSPLYTSLMNYDYNYSFGEDANAVHFSEGKFGTVRLNEARLSERQLRPASDLEFLRKAPYRFKVESTGPRTSGIDWNRNGVIDDGIVRADISDGYSVTLKNVEKLGKAAGSPAFTAYGNSLIVVYPDLASANDYNSYGLAGPTKDRKARVVARVFDGTVWKPKSMLAPSATGDPSAAVYGMHLVVAYPTEGSYILQAHNPTTLTRLSISAGLDDVKRGQERWPTLVTGGSPQTLWLLLWNEVTGEITYRKVGLSSDGRRFDLGPVQLLRTSSIAVKSTNAVGAVYDTVENKIALVTGENEGSTVGRMKVHLLSRTRDTWQSVSSSWTTGSGGWARTRSKPGVVFDPSRDRGPKGGYLIYHKGDATPSRSPARTYAARSIGDTTVSGGWRVALMGNEWVNTASSPAAIMYGGDIVYALRWSGGEDDNELMVWRKASGITNGIIADHDDVSFIRATGLKRSLGR